MRGGNKGKDMIFFSLLQSATLSQRRLRLGPTAADKPSEGRKGWDMAVVWRNGGDEGSAEAFTKATSNQRACLEWPTKCHLSHHFFLTPDGEITCFVILSLRIPGHDCAGGDPANSI